MSEVKMAEQAKKEILSRIAERISQKHKHNGGGTSATIRHNAHGSTGRPHSSHINAGR